MNNKGFAITGILYTIFILFILTLFAVLTGLNTRERLMKKSIESLEYEFVYHNYYYFIDEDVAKENGLYYFSNSDTGNYCYSYLKKGDKLSEAIFVRENNDDGCQEHNDKFTVDRYYVRGW